MHTASDTGVISSYHHHENISGWIIKTRSILPASSQVQYTRNEATSNQIYIWNVRLMKAKQQALSLSDAWMQRGGKWHRMVIIYQARLWGHSTMEHMASMPVKMKSTLCNKIMCGVGRWYFTLQEGKLSLLIGYSLPWGRWLYKMPFSHLKWVTWPFHSPWYLMCGWAWSNECL